MSVDADSAPSEARLESTLLESGAPKGQAALAGILLHGRDRTREDKVVLASSFGVEGIRWLAPAADTGSWYPGRFFDPRSENEPFLTKAVEQCDRVVEEAGEDGRLGADHLVMVGFSQGACLALEYALQRPGRCGSLIVLTGALIGPPDTVWPSSPDLLAGLRVLLTGSDADDWITEDQTRHTARILEGLGADVRLLVYHGRPHIVSEDEMKEARLFLKVLMRSTACHSHPL
ncbi:MAG: alpha/beta fold hydrolase [Acidobacteriia bacterium]|nr:alpha/beta fold hydrolase [Terriglobia bacterium]